MKDVYDYLHMQDEDVDSLPRVDLSESEKQDVLDYIRMKDRGPAAAPGPSAHRKGRRSGKAFAVLLAASLAVCGTVYAAVRWNRGLEQGMQIAHSQQEKLETENYAQTVGKSCTDAGITVTADQCIVDNYFAYLSFTVKGYTLPDGAQPDFENTDISVDGADGCAGGGGFYDGTVKASDETVMYADGTPAETNADGTLISHYVQEDGSMQYTWTVSAGIDKGALIGKPIHVSLQNLGSYREKAEFIRDIEGTWTFDFTLPGSSSAKEVKINAAMGDTGATVKRAEISPVSLYVVMDYPRQEEMTEFFEDENGETEKFTQWKKAPALCGVRYKDGTLLPFITEAGNMDYTDEQGTEYAQRRALDRVIDVGQVDALLFNKNTYQSGLPTEDDFYVVPIG